MIAAVPGRAMPVAVGRFPGQQFLKGEREVILRSAPHFDERDAGGGVRREDQARTVPQAVAEGLDIGGEVREEPPAGVKVKERGLHPFTVADKAKPGTAGDRSRASPVGQAVTPTRESPTP